VIGEIVVPLLRMLAALSRSREFAPLVVGAEANIAILRFWIATSLVQAVVQRE
jgi:hypothetical protein